MVAAKVMDAINDHNSVAIKSEALQVVKLATFQLDGIPRVLFPVQRPHVRGAATSIRVKRRRVRVDQ
jgi:hypothetical protein